MKTLSIVIVNYNVKHFLEQALLSVRKAVQNIDTEIFVVDNNSVDGSVEMVRKKFPEVTLIASKKNLGFSKGNNLAMREATGKYVLLLNPDTIVQEDTFHKCIQFMEENPSAGALGVKMINGIGEFLPESKRSLPTPWVAFYKIFGLATIFPTSERFGKYHLTYLDKDQTHEIEVLSGAYMFMRKSVLDEIGLLDEDYFMYGEDIDLSYRVTKAGYKNYYLSDTQIVHYKGESTKKGSLNYVMVFYNAMLIFAKKHFSKSNQSLFMLLIRSAIYFRAGVSVVKRLYDSFAFPALEFLLIFLLSIGMKGIWEKNVFLSELGGHTYPEEFNTIAAPIYALIFTVLLMVSGAYKKPYPLRPLFTTAFVGFIAIATISFIFKQINFSRGIVALVSGGTLFLSLTTRAISNYFHSGHIFFDKKFNKKTIILGDFSEAERIKDLIHNDLAYDCELIGVVTNEGTEGQNTLGTLEQLFEIIHFYKVEEIIFCNDTFTTRQIIQVMGQLHEQKVSFKIVPKDADYLIGPNFIYVASPHTGLIFSNLAKPESHYKKVFFDFIVSSGLMVLFPLIFWAFEKPKQAWKNIWNVWKGNYHWVGYIDGSSPDLPPLKHGLLDMSSLRKTKTEEHKQLDRQYARHYSWGLDLQIFLKGFKKIGRALS